MADNPETTSGSGPANLITVEVAYATPAKQLILKLRVNQGTTAGEAIEASGIREHFPEIEPRPVVGIFSRKTALDSPLSDGDRVEIYRPLVADPKEVRRQKAELEKAARKKRA